jgi:hypothetical protein
MINKKELKKQAIMKASALATGAYLTRIRRICDSQKTIKTSRLECEIDRIDDYLLEIASFMNMLQKEIDCGD